MEPYYAYHAPPHTVDIVPDVRRVSEVSVHIMTLSTNTIPLPCRSSRRPSMCEITEQLLQSHRAALSIEMVDNDHGDEMARSHQQLLED